MRCNNTEPTIPRQPTIPTCFIYLTFISYENVNLSVAIPYIVSPNKGHYPAHRFLSLLKCFICHQRYLSLITVKQI
ncbi:hypothetical protein UUU_19690 [Klebsiella pneumoniae subsp. pneumoniae DSM 30104 = JCM 1662 = NBRC 14940]|nr:hypothetical protein UUU_19690 [Klebsiella pneumoniae subsp. pneumoniae DSM 30104 = JCM 1662 = NBRC 14940]